MRILGIETSCDDTCISVIEVKDKGLPSFRMLSNIISSQIEVHKKWGGVYPLLARREHQKNIVPVMQQALKESGLLIKKKNNEVADIETLKKILEREGVLSDLLIEFVKKYQKPKIDLIAVTHGPGLEPSLWTGINLAKALSFCWDIPLAPINHIEAHLIISFFSLEKDILKYRAASNIFPAVGLIVSGGHTQLIVMEKFGKYELIGETRDDAAGECFDKTARILGLDYPGGPEISKKAGLFKGGKEIRLPRPMIGSKDFDFSFSGLKTAVLYHHLSHSPKNEKYVREMSHEIEQAISGVLISKTLSAFQKFKAKSIVLGGGVTANKELQRQLEKRAKPNTKILFPPQKAQMDNALMIAVSGFFKKSSRDFKKIGAQANLRI